MISVPCHSSPIYVSVIPTHQQMQIIVCNKIQQKCNCLCRFLLSRTSLFVKKTSNHFSVNYSSNETYCSIYNFIKQIVHCDIVIVNTDCTLQCSPRVHSMFVRAVVCFECVKNSTLGLYLSVQVKNPPCLHRSSIPHLSLTTTLSFTGLKYTNI